MLVADSTISSWSLRIRQGQFLGPKRLLRPCGVALRVLLPDLGASTGLDLSGEYSRTPAWFIPFHSATRYADHQVITVKADWLEESTQVVGVLWLSASTETLEYP